MIFNYSIIFSISYTVQNHTCFAILKIVMYKDKTCFYTESTDFKDCCKIVLSAEHIRNSAFQNANFRDLVFETQKDLNGNGNNQWH